LDRPNRGRALALAMLALWLFLAHATRASWSAPNFVWSDLAWVAIAAAACAAFPALGTLAARAIGAPRRAVFVGAASLGAALLSWWVVRGPVGDKPVAIDAGVYLMEARALAHGSLGVPISGPGLAHASKFLFEGADGRLFGVFPPGYPLFLAPFVWLGAPMAAGPVTAALLVCAQYALARAVAADDVDLEAGDRELFARGSLLATLPSWSRAMETADLLAHAFLAVVAAASLALALRMRGATRANERGPSWMPLALGALLGWGFAARMLDGLVLAGAALALLLARAPRPSPRALAAVAAGAVPFVVLLALHQHAATGSWTTPTQSAYFARSDYPPTCHRLGFGADVGCTVEHPDSRAAMGADGYGLDDALRVTRERASALGGDLFGAAPLVLLAFVPLFVRSAPGDWLCAAFSLALTLGYGLFYYGNSPMYGARHLFPAAPCLYVLAARALARLPSRSAPGARFCRAHVVSGALLALVAGGALAQRRQWRDLGAMVAAFQSGRSDLRRTAKKHQIHDGIIKSPDPTAIAAAMDPWVDRGRRLYVLDDRSGLQDLRRRHPDLPVMLSLAGDELGRLYATDPPPPGLLLELERAWPSYQAPRGLGAVHWETSLEGIRSGRVLLLHHASIGSYVDIAFEAGQPGTYALHLDGIAGPDQGDYEASIDGAPLAPWKGYAPARAKRSSEPVKLDVGPGRHVLRLRCSGKSVESEGFDAQLDALVGVLP
jgi:hypothetical protein